LLNDIIFLIIIVNKNTGVLFFFVLLQQPKPVRAIGGQQWSMIARQGGSKTNIDGILRLNTPFVRAAKGKRTFSERYLSVNSNFANLNLLTEVMQRSVRVGVLYTGLFLAISVFC